MKLKEKLTSVLKRLENIALNLQRTVDFIYKFLGSSDHSSIFIGSTLGGSLESKSFQL